MMVAFSRIFPRCRMVPFAVGLLGLIVAGILAGPAAATETIAREAILLEMETGAVLFEKGADTPTIPASLTKMMTVYMVFERLRDGSLSLDDKFRVSETAWRKGGAKSGSSTMFLEPGTRAAVEDLLRGVIVQSGNDACIVLAEALAGSEEKFADAMTRRGQELGLQATTFKNATGWPDPGHVSTVRDLAILVQRTIQDFPQYYRYYAEKSFIYNGIRQGNRNPLLYKNMGADGLKTGHTQESGYGLASSAKRGDRRLILVVHGLPSKKARGRESERLLEWGFREFNNYALFQAGDTVSETEVWLGKNQTVPLVIEGGLTITMPRKARRQMKVAITYEGPVPAPVTRGQPLAKLVVTVPDREPIEARLVAGENVERLGLFGRLGAALNYILWGVSG